MNEIDRKPQAARQGRFDRWDVSFTLIALVAFALIMWMGRSFTFWHDDWRFMATRTDWSVSVFLEPLNGHWIALPTLLWKILLETVGLAAYWPKLMLLAVAHVAVGGSVYWGVRNIAGPAAGLAAGVLMLSLGAAGSLLFMGHALDFVASTALGAWALMLVFSGGRRRLVVAAVLLVMAVMSGGNALPFLVAAAVYLFFADGRWRDLWVPVPALGLYGVWWLVEGRSGSSIGFRPTLGGTRDLWEFVRDGIATAGGMVLGLSMEIGLVIVAVLVIVTIWQLLGRGPFLYTALAAMAGFVSVYVLVGLVGVNHPGREATAFRYVYPAAAFIITAVAAWYGAMPRTRPRNALPLLAVLLWAVIANVVQLRWWAEEYVPRQVDLTRATISIVLEHGGTERLPADRWPVHKDPFLTGIPRPERVLEIVDRYGSPLGDPPNTGPAEIRARLEAEILDQPE